MVPGGVLTSRVLACGLVDPAYRGADEETLPPSSMGCDRCRDCGTWGSGPAERTIGHPRLPAPGAYALFSPGCHGVVG